MHFHNFTQNLIFILHSKLQLFIFWQEIWRYFLFLPKLWHSGYYSVFCNGKSHWLTTS